jgi:hypothetical protein
LKKGCAFLLSLLLLFGLSTTAYAEDAVISTTVPNNHIVTIETEGGQVTADGVICGETLAVERQKEQTYQFLPDDGKTLESVTYNGEDVTAQVVDGTFTAPAIIADSTLKVVFKDAPASENEEQDSDGDNSTGTNQDTTPSTENTSNSKQGTTSSGQGKKTPTQSASTSPKTGDQSNVLLWSVLFILSASALAVLSICERRRRKDER